MRFSLIVATVGRAAELRLLLRSFRAQRRTDFEVIVVDQSGQEEVATALAEFAGEFPILHVPMAERGASRGRNLGLERARGEIVAFPDDDCTYPEGVLDRVAELFDTRDDLDALTMKAVVMSRNDARGGPVNRRNILGRSVEFTLFARRQRLGDLRFDERLGPGAGTPWGADEGPDLMLRMLARGLRIEYFPELEIRHPDALRVYDRQTLKRAYFYSCGRGRLFRRHRFPLASVAWSMFRSFAGSALMLATCRPRRAQFYWLSFTGKLRGYFSVEGKTPSKVR